MSKTDKLLSRLLSKPKDFTFEEVRSLLGKFGYKEDNKGKTSGSRIKFYNKENKIINLHKPHETNTIKTYMIDLLIDKLKENGDIE